MYNSLRTRDLPLKRPRITPPSLWPVLHTRSTPLHITSCSYWTYKLLSLQKWKVRWITLPRYGLACADSSHYIWIAS